MSKFRGRYGSRLCFEKQNCDNGEGAILDFRVPSDCHFRVGQDGNVEAKVLITHSLCSGVTVPVVLKLGSMLRRAVSSLGKSPLQQLEWRQGAPQI
jgi:hypothetical protein